ncbi:MAG: hypothetical protein AW09_003925 [Candidatus Accumulibacter phosphatis]|jgi:hypothetical protein|uniref:Glycosyltransferase RgtA/B/C/D-like domain-containing protein n=1 Tax=Candidatus Accumulibacter phosphatis TaxID=327160 RepID=A0A080LRS2_9PROT|nr:MAG: hypothetical protein AW09_003925 [Candidatus Accumulibacter phosphatis]
MTDIFGTVPASDIRAPEEIRVGYWIICFAATIQFLLLAYSFPLDELLSQTPILFSDAGYHWYHMKLAVALAHDGTQSAYDPFFAAGLPRGVFLDPSANFPAVLAALFSPAISEAVLYKLHAFASALLAPISVLAAARLLDVPRRQAIIAFVFGLLLFWTSYFHWYYTSGMVSFVTAAYLVLPFTAMFLRYTSGRGGGWSLIGIGMFGAIAFFYHPLFPVIAAVFIGSWLLLSFRDIAAWRTVGALTVIPLLSLLPNLPWLAAIQEYAKAFPVVDSMSAYQTKVDPAKIWKELFAIDDGAKIYAPIAVLSLWGAIKEKQQGRRTVLISSLLAGGILIVFAAIGASVPPFRALQPNRFSPVAYLLLTLPAAFGMVHMYRSLWAQRPALRAVATLTAVVSVVPTSYAAYELAREVSYANIGHVGKKPPMIDGVGPYTIWLENWIRENTDGSSRILFEVSLPRVYDGGRITGYLALQTNREFIGGPYPYLHSASFQKGQAFGKALEKLPAELFMAYLDLYNIGWIIVNTPTNTNYIETLPNVQTVASHKEIRIYRVSQTPSYFLKGHGTITNRKFNRVEATDVTGDSIVLKYHYHDQLTILPQARIYPIKTDLDPIPFIGIDSPPRKFTLSIR